jgi:hypothetical protein
MRHYGHKYTCGNDSEKKKQVNHRHRLHAVLAVFRLLGIHFCKPQVVNAMIAILPGGCEKWIELGRRARDHQSQLIFVGSRGKNEEASKPQQQTSSSAAVFFTYDISLDQICTGIRNIYTTDRFVQRTQSKRVFRWHCFVAPAARARARPPIIPSARNLGAWHYRRGIPVIHAVARHRREKKKHTATTNKQQHTWLPTVKRGTDRTVPLSGHLPLLGRPGATASRAVVVVAGTNESGISHFPCHHDTLSREFPILKHSHRGCFLGQGDADRLRIVGILTIPKNLRRHHPGRLVVLVSLYRRHQGSFAQTLLQA